MMALHPEGAADVRDDQPPRSVVDEAVRAALRVIDANIARFGDRYPADTTVDGVYPLRPALNGLSAGSNHGWTTSFWPGVLWLAYELTSEERYKVAAERHVTSFMQRVAAGVDVDTHDLGFLYTLSCVVPARQTGDLRAREAALRAAERLMARFLEPAGIIQAWGDLGNPRERGRTIIDSLMNTSLLYWAGGVTGEERFSSAAHRHTSQLRDNIIRADGTTFHTFYWNPETGEPLRGATEQGQSDGSCWARGQAWGIYGFALNYRHTEDESFLHAATTCADYFLDHLPSDRVAYWDLEFSDGSGQERDSSAAAVAASGLLELANCLPPGPSTDRYRTEAAAILESLMAAYSTAAAADSNALLLRGVYDKPKGVGVNEGTLWGDYFYLEALTRHVAPDWVPYW
jgi:unsaturated chondroitin disaccharide hydrolase